MKKNIGNWDKLLRLMIVLAIALSNHLALLPTKINYFFLFIAIYILYTTFTNSSPIYKFLGINTNKSKR